MKKVIFTMLVLLSMLALLTGTVAAAPLADGVLTLVEVRNDGGGGVIFVFNFSGDFSRSQLKGGTVNVNGESFNLSCSQVSGETIQCTTTRKVGGQNVVVNLAGFIFWAFVPAARGASGPTQYCYGVYDLYFDPDTETWYWDQFDTNCQDAPANVGDTLDSGQEFMEDSPFCYVDPLSDDAYYGECPT